MGPNTELRGAPLITGDQLDRVSPTLTHWNLPVTNDSIQDKSLPVMPIQLSLYSNLECTTQSKALEKSKYIQSICAPFETLEAIKSWYFKSCKIVDFLGRNPNWLEENMLLSVQNETISSFTMKLAYKLLGSLDPPFL